MINLLTSEIVNICGKTNVNIIQSAAAEHTVFAYMDYLCLFVAIFVFNFMLKNRDLFSRKSLIRNKMLINNEIVEEKIISVILVGVFSTIITKK